MEDFEEVFPSYPKLDDPLFPYKICNKKEFKILGKENLIKNPGDLLNHQKICVQYLNPETPYSKLVVNHDPGTGKTYIASSVAEKYMHRVVTPLQKAEIEKAGFKEILNDHRAIFISNKLSVLNNFRQHLEKFHNYSKSGTGGTKKYDDYYEIISAGTFAKQVEQIQDERTLKRMYSYRVIIIDEIQTIREEFEQPIKKTKKTKMNKKTGVEVKVRPPPYLQIKRLMKCDGLVVLLLTATLKRERPEEVTKVFNLILPDHQKLNGKDIIKLFKKDEESSLPKVEDVRKYMYPNISGYVSHMESSFAPELKEQGESFELYDEVMSNMKVIECPMNEIQYRNYYDVANLKNKYGGSTEKVQTKIYLEERQALNIVFCNENGENRHSGKHGVANYILKKQNKFVSSFQTFLSYDSQIVERIGKDIVRKLDVLKIIENIGKVGIKFSKILEYIHNNPNRPQFVYNEFVESGANVFAMFLDLLGYERFTLLRGHPGNESLLSKLKPGKRYILLTGEEQAKGKGNQRLIEEFNDPLNQRGEYIQVVIGSKVASISINFTNVRDVHFVDPVWAPSEITQIVGRAMRRTSLLHYRGTPEYYVNVFHYVSVFKDEYDYDGRFITEDMSYPPEIQTEDEYMYWTVEMKNRKIQLMQKVIVESSIDCFLNKYSYSKINDGQLVFPDYECIGYEIDKNSNKIVRYPVVDELSSYKSYFLNDNINIFMKTIIELFMVHHILPLNLLTEFIKSSYFGISAVRDITVDKYSIINAINTLINIRYRFKDRFGDVYYMKMKNDIVFLSNMEDNNHSLESYYTKHIQIKTTQTVFKESIDIWVSKFEEETANIIDEREFFILFKHQERETRIKILELSLPESSVYMDKTRREFVISEPNFKHWWRETEKFYVHYLGQREVETGKSGNIITFSPKQRTRVFDKTTNGPWRLATKKEDQVLIDEYNKLNEVKINSVTQLGNNYMLIGTLLEDRQGKKNFRLIDLSKNPVMEEGKKVDRRKYTTGINIYSSKNKETLVEYLWRLQVRVSYPLEADLIYENYPNTAEDIMKERYKIDQQKLDEMKTIQYTFGIEDDPKFKTKYVFFYEWASIHKFMENTLCNEIRKAIENKNLLLFTDI